MQTLDYTPWLQRDMQAQPPYYNGTDCLVTITSLKRIYITKKVILLLTGMLNLLITLK